MSADRVELKRAVTYADVELQYRPEGIDIVVPRDLMRALRDAAAKHLETLPKLMWHVTGTSTDGSPAAGAWLVEQTNALDTARSWLRCGWTNVSVKQGYRP